MAANASTDCGVGIMSEASSGITINAPIPTTWARIDSGTVYHCLVPTLICRVGHIAEHFMRHRWTSCSRALSWPRLAGHHEVRDYSQSQKTVSTNLSKHAAHARHRLA